MLLSRRIGTDTIILQSPTATSSKISAFKLKRLLNVQLERLSLYISRMNYCKDWGRSILLLLTLIHSDN